MITYGIFHFSFKIRFISNCWLTAVRPRWNMILKWFRIKTRYITNIINKKDNGIPLVSHLEKIESVGLLWDLKVMC